MGAFVVGPVLPEGEPVAGPWREVAMAELLEILKRFEVPGDRPRIVAIDGRGAAASRPWLLG